MKFACIRTASSLKRGSGRLISHTEGSMNTKLHTLTDAKAAR